MWFDEFNSPIGQLVIATDTQGLRHILLENDKFNVADRGSWRRDKMVLREAREQLLAYFAGERKQFDLPLHPVGTLFQLKVWHTLAEIAFGETWSYSDVAKRIGKPSAVRAVGAANGRNPLPIVLPCHRVIGRDGSLTGFAGGLPMKQFLLEHEEVGQSQLKF